jgi:hypothetical protein
MDWTVVAGVNPAIRFLLTEACWRNGTWVKPVDAAAPIIQGCWWPAPLVFKARVERGAEPRQGSAHTEKSASHRPAMRPARAAATGLVQANDKTPATSSHDVRLTVCAARPLER